MPGIEYFLNEDVYNHFEAELDDLKDNFEAELDDLKDNFGGVAFKRLQKDVTIPAGSSTSPALVEIDLSNEISGNVMSADIWIGAMHLPYTNSSGLVCTWVYDAVGKKIRIANAASEWRGYTAYILVGYLQ